MKRICDVTGVKTNNNNFKRNFSSNFFFISTLVPYYIL